ncbi:MAG: hypothetical protein WC508_04700 [Patescibacteria group bacterium]
MEVSQQKINEILIKKSHLGSAIANSSKQLIKDLILEFLSYHPNL